MAHLDFDSVQPALDFDSFTKARPASAGPLSLEVPAVAAGRYRASHEPTLAQLAAGNYPKRKLSWQGMTIAIENEAGSVRAGTDPSGRPWQTRMLFAYGYFLRTEAVDGDHVDVYVGPCEGAAFVYVVHQRKAGDWLQYDEDKAFINFASEADAVQAFLQHYDDLRFLGPVTTLPVAEFVSKARATFAAPAMIKSVRWAEAAQADFGQAMLAKAEHGPIPAGARWITVNGGEGQGQPILVVPHPDGSMRVIGGAGGSLNHLKLRSVKAGESSADAIRQRQQDAQAKRQAQTAADKADGTHEAKQAERGKLKAEMQKQRKEFVQTVAEAMGWEGLDFDESQHAGLSEEAMGQARKDHDKELFRRAKEAVDVNRKMLLSDHDALAASGLGDMPLQAQSADVLSVADLDPLKEGKPGLGFAASYGARAQKQGLTPDAVAAELTDVQGAQAQTPEQVQTAADKAAGKKAEAADIAQELEAFKLANPETPKFSPKVLKDAQKAAALVKAQKKLRLAEGLARQASLELANARVVESKSYVLEASDAEIEEAARQQMEQDVSTIGAVGLLSEIDKMGGEESLGGHVGAGAFNALNAFATAAGGEPLIDRSVVDVLGINAAAQVLARRMASDYSKADFAAIRQGVEDFHIASQGDKQEQAVAQARALTDAAAAIELPDGVTGFDLAQAQELNHRRREAVNDAKRILGQATGELQANAALVMALRQGAKKSIEVSLGRAEAKSAITQLRAIGLKSGDYQLQDVGGSLVATVTGEGLDRIAKPVDVEGLKQISRNLEIIRGEQDQEGWLPQGFASRPDLAMDVEPGVAPKLAQAFDPSGGDLPASLRSYIGGRVADGDALQDILADVQSSDFFAKSGDPEGYRAALDEVAPLKGEGGKMKPIDSLQDAFEQLADAFVQDKYGEGTSPLHRQSFAVDKQSVDALHRALSATPEGVAAFKAVGDLTAQERGGLRKWWESNVAREDAAGAGLKSDLADHEKNEPEKESTDMFGESSVNPDWHAWKATRDELAGKANAAGLDWGKYVTVMGSPTAAILATQDLVRSRVVSGFAEAHNRLKPGAPLKVGKTTIQGALQHLDAVDPVAREKRLASQKELIDSLRERIDGKYASGSVADKIQAQKEAQAAFEQAQMGFFSTEELGGDLFGDAGGAGGAGDKAKAPEVKLGADERLTLGHAAEQKLAGMMSVVGQNFRPGKPTKLWNASMSGKFAPQQRAIKLHAANKRLILGYGAGCVYGGTQLTCARTGVTQSFYEWWLSGKRPTVVSVSKDGMRHRVEADPVFVKGYEPMVRVFLANGASILVTRGHRFMKNDGGWVYAGDLQPGALLATGGAAPLAFSSDRHLDGVTQRIRHQAAVFAPKSGASLPVLLHPKLCAEFLPLSASARSSVAALFLAAHQSMLDGSTTASHQKIAAFPQGSSSELSQKARPSSGRHCTGKAQDLMDGCSACSCLCDGPLRSEAVGGPAVEPSPFGAQECSHSFESQPRLALESGHTRPCQSSGHLSTTRSVAPGMPMEPCALSRAASCDNGSPRSQPEKSRRFAPDSGLCRDKGRATHQVLPSSFSFPLPSSEVLSVEDAGEHIVFDLTVPVFHNYMAQGMVNHNSGKTGIMLGSTAHLIKTGAIKRALHLVPSIVQDQYGGEATRYLEPGQFKWHCQPGASQAERIAAYKDPSNHFCVMTHESFRADALHLGAQHAGIDAKAMSAQVDAMTAEGRRDWMKGVLEKEGIDFGATYVDEAHQIVNRAGKANSARANVIDALSDNTPYYAYASGDPIKNDISELHDVLSKMDRKRYGDRDAFMRAYGGNSVAAKASLKREMVRYGISNLIAPDVKADYQNIQTPLSSGQQGALKEIDKTLARLKQAKDAGTVDVEAAKALSPSAFAGIADDQQEVVAKSIQESSGIVRESAIKRVINSFDGENPKISKMLELADKHKGQPGVVFAHNRAAVEQIVKALQAKGHKVTTITGSDSGQEKARKRALFQPESGEPQADIMVCSDAGAVGQNLQRGSWLVQHDVPDTAKDHGQRAARIHRLGQKNNVSVYTLSADHKSERNALTRLKKKYELREMMLDPMDGLDDTGVAGAISKRMHQKQQAALV